MRIWDLYKARLDKALEFEEACLQAEAVGLDLDMEAVAREAIETQKSLVEVIRARVHRKILNG